MWTEQNVLKLLCVMLSNVQWKCYGCCLYGMNNRKACVLDIDMEQPSVMSCKVLCSYADSIHSVRYLPMLSVFCICVFNNSHVPNL